MDPTNTDQTFDTRACTKGERLSFWADAICTHILPVQIDPRADADLASNAMRASSFGDLQLREVIGGQHVYVRSSRDIRKGDPNTLQMGLQLHGHAILEQDGRQAELREGDLVLYDSSRPFTLAMEERFNWQVFLLPKDRLRRSEREMSALTATTISSRHGTGGIAARFLRDLVRNGREAGLARAELAELASDVISAVVRSEFGRTWEVTDPHRLLLGQAVAYIAEHLGDPRLGPDLIAHAVGVSTRRLHQLFAVNGETVCGHIRTERIDAIRRDLSDVRLAKTAISRLAAERGLVNPSMFSRLFRDLVGVTPREYRAEALSLIAPAPVG